MRRVVNTNEVPHLWAHQSQDDARSNGNLSFTGRHLYSYSTMIGTIIDAPNGEQAYLLNTYYFSPTTGKHQSYASRAIPAGRHAFEIELGQRGSWLDRMTPTEILDSLAAKIPEQVQLTHRARANKPYRFNTLQGMIAKAQEFAALFNLPLDLPAIDIDNLGALVEEYTKREVEQVAAPSKARQEQEAERQQVALEKLGVWCRYSLSAVYGLKYDYLRLSADKDHAQTSRGLSVPITDVVKVLPFVMKVVEAGTDQYPFNDFIRKSFPLGDFQLTGYKDHVLIVGCHKFEYTEILRFAEELRTAGIV